MYFSHLLHSFIDILSNLWAKSATVGAIATYSIIIIIIFVAIEVFCSCCLYSVHILIIYA